MKFAPSSTAILQCDFRTSLSRKADRPERFQELTDAQKINIRIHKIFLSPRGGSVLRRAAPAFEILMFAPVRRFFPEPRQRLNGGWRRSRVLHPSEDLSELPPLRSVVAGQEYHCPRMRLRQNSLPKLLLDGWVPLVTLLGRLYTEKLYRWSSRILRIAVPFLAHPLDVIQSLDMYFSICTR